MGNETPQAFDSPIVANKFAPTSTVIPVRGHRALRRGRVSIPNRTYFITACTHERQHLFQTPAAAGLVFQHLYALEVQLQAIELIASIVMPDHVHAVFALRSEEVTLV